MANHTYPTTFWLPEGIIFQGLFKPGHIYFEEDVMVHNDKPFVCTVSKTSGEIPNSEHWKLFSPQDYIHDEWSPKYYPEGLYVLYNDKTYYCLRSTTTDPTDPNCWVEQNYNYQGYWSPCVYKAGDIVKFKNQIYQCIQEATTEKPSDTSYWSRVETSEKKKVFEWKVKQYDPNDIVIYEDHLYICTNTTTENPLSEFWRPLPKNAKWQGHWKHLAYPKKSIVKHNGALYVSLQEATIQPLTDTNYWYELTITWKDTWVQQDYQAGDYLIYDNQAFLCIQDTQCEHPSNQDYWYIFCESGVQFPPWFPSPKSIEINIPYDEELTYSASSGGWFWPISPPKLLGTKVVSIDCVPEEMAELFTHQSSITEVYLLSEWHAGEFESNGDTNGFYGATIDGYYEGTEGLIPMINPKTREGKFRFYIQWRSGIPHIAQPDEWDWLILTNREPHPKIKEFFKIAAHHIQASNRMRIDATTFENEMQDVISAKGYSESESRRETQASNKGELFEPMSYETYRAKRMTEWVKKKYEAKMIHLQLGETLHQKAEKQVAIWKEQNLKNLKSQMHLISSKINEIARGHIGTDKWFGMSAAECKKIYPQIKWVVQNENISLSDIESERINAEKQWDKYNTLTGAEKMLEIFDIEKSLESILKMFPKEQKEKKNIRRKKNNKMNKVK